MQVSSRRASNIEAVKLHAAARQHACQARGEDLRQVILSANADGIDLLRRGQPVMAFEQLKYAEAVLVSTPDIGSRENELLALTCSNLGCYYRKAGLPRAALRYLGRALQAEKAADASVFQDVCTLATTKLNACAALSGVGRHEEAEKLAVVAMQLLTPQDGSSPTREECSLLAVACHNLGAEREHLGRWAPAAVAYRQGSEVSDKVLGPKNVLTRTLADRCAQALSRAERNPFTPRRPPSVIKHGKQGMRRPCTAPGAARCPPMAGQGHSLLFSPAGPAAQESQGEELLEDMLPDEILCGRHSEQDAVDLQRCRGLSAVCGGPVDLEEPYAVEDDEGAMRDRILPTLTTVAPDGRSRTGAPTLPVRFSQHARPEPWQRTARTRNIGHSNAKTGQELGANPQGQATEEA